MNSLDHNTRKNRWARVILLAAGLVISAVVAEVGLRVYASIDASFGRAYRGFDVLSAKVEAYGIIGYRPKPHTKFRYSNGNVATTNGLGFRGPTVLIPKGRATFRILLLGGSTTHGWAVNDNETIDAYLRELLNDRYPTRQFDVVNLAFDGYDSYQLVERLRTDGLSLDPDLIIVNSGINDVRNAKFAHLKDPDPRTLLWPGIFEAHRDRQRLGRQTLFTQLKHVSYLARLPGFLRNMIITWRSEKRDRDSPPNPAAIEYFGRNLRRIVALAGDRNTPIIFSSPPSALSTKYAPQDVSSISYWLANAATTEKYRSALSNRMRAVVAELTKEQYPARYVNHNVPSSMFLDDAHLKPEGNRQMAKDFVDAAEPYVIAYLRHNSPSVSTSPGERPK